MFGSSSTMTCPSLWRPTTKKPDARAEMGRGHCIAFYGIQDMEKMEKFLSGKPIAEREIGMQLLQEVSGYAETPTSRRQYILHYFGEEFDPNAGPGWDMDDNARNPPESYSGKDTVVHLLKLVKASGGKRRGGILVRHPVGPRDTGNQHLRGFRSRSLNSKAVEPQWRMRTNGPASSDR